MCLAIPSRIVEIEGLRAVIDVYGARRDVNLMLLPEEVRLGDYVLVHAGFALQRVDTDAAEDSLRLIGTILEDVKKDIAAELSVEDISASDEFS